MHKLTKICEELKITKPTLYNWKKKGIIVFHKIGGLNFISDGDRNKLLKINEKT